MVRIFIHFTLLSRRIFSFDFCFLLCFEDIKGKTSVFAESGVDNELVLLIRMSEVYDLFTIVIYVGRVIIIFSDTLLGRYKFANIGS